MLCGQNSKILKIVFYDVTLEYFIILITLKMLVAMIITLKKSRLTAVIINYTDISNFYKHKSSFRQSPKERAKHKSINPCFIYCKYTEISLLILVSFQYVV